MALSDKPLEAITEAGLQALIVNGVAERKTIEYKKTLPGGNDEQRKEFLADVSSFANASGGDLLFGIEEDKGVPVNLVGVDAPDPDQLKLALENSVQTGIRPRLTGVQTTVVPCPSVGSDKAVVIMRTRRSFAAPHMIWFKQSGKFFTRDSAGKHQLDVDELRAAYARSATFAERLRAFRRERLSDAISGELPAVLEPGAKLLLHIVPFTAFDLGAGARYDLSALDTDTTLRQQLKPISGTADISRHLFEGYLTVDRQTDTECGGYTLLYRDGIMEAVDAHLLRAKYRGKGDTIPGDLLEAHLVKALPRYLSVQQALGVEPPFAVLLTLMGVRDFYMVANRATSDYYNRNPHDVLDMAEVIVEQYEDVTEQTAAQVLRPLFDAVWNATGYARSPNYNEDGTWQPQVNVPN